MLERLSQCIFQLDKAKKVDAADTKITGSILLEWGSRDRNPNYVLLRAAPGGALGAELFTSASSDVILLVRIFNRSAS